MKTVSFTPKACQGEGATFEGTVSLRLPTFDEKYEYLEKMEVEVDEEGKVELKKGSNLKKVRQMVAMSSGHYVAVALKKKASGEEFKSFADLSVDADAEEILIEIGLKVISGFNVGNG